MMVPEQAKMTIAQLEMERETLLSDGVEWVENKQAIKIFGCSRMHFNHLLSQGIPISWKFKGNSQRLFGVRSLYDYQISKVMENLKEYK